MTDSVRERGYQEGDVVALFPMSASDIAKVVEPRTTSRLESERRGPPGPRLPVQEGRDWLAELIKHESYIEQLLELLGTIEVDKVIHVVTDGGAHPNPGPAELGDIVRQNKKFTAVWKHFDHASNNAMDLRAVIETLKYLPPHMIVWVSTDSKYAKNGITEPIHK
jgi:hypothetical protein